MLALIVMSRLCVEYEARGGGYLKAKDRRNNKILPPVPYAKNIRNRQVCYLFDDVPPAHCSATRSCTFEPMHLNERISRNSVHTVTFRGWSDPVPPGGSVSQIEQYEIRVNEVIPSKGTNKVDYSANVLSLKVNNVTTEMTLNLPSDKPHLYCVTLEVKDAADNVRQCRRFILIDDKSFIISAHNQQFRFISAAPETDFTWQTQFGDICVSWKEYFFNSFYRDNPLFNGIEAAPRGLITGTYEQIDGKLPVSGTPNVHGIVKFMVSWKLNNGPFSPETEMPDIMNQTFCKSLLLVDGYMYTFKIRPIDIVGNTQSDGRRVSFDSSRPSVRNLCLRNETTSNSCSSFITNQKPLLLEFEAGDSHSGVKRLRWSFGKFSESNAGGVFKEITSGDLRNVSF